MTSHHEKLTAVVNDIEKDILELKDLPTRVQLIQQFDEARTPLYALLTNLQKEKEREADRVPSANEIPDVVIKGTYQPSGLVIDRSTEYVDKLFTLSKEEKCMLNDFIHLYANSMLSAFMIVEGKCLTTEVTRRDVKFGKYTINSFTVCLEE